MSAIERSDDPTERAFAALAHASGIFFPLLGPLVVLILKGKSRFVKAHALNALIGMLMLNAFLFLIGAISLTITILSLYKHYQENWENFNIWHVLIRSAITWIILGLIGVINTVVNIFQAIRAWNGNVPGRGITGAIVKKLMRGKRELEPAN